MTIRKRVLPVLTIFLLIAACGGGKGGSPSFRVGGAVSGLAGTGLVLQDNGRDDLMVSSDGNFVFATAAASGSAYAVTVKSQPSTPSQTCTAASGSGTVATANVTDVVITCVTNTYKVSVSVRGLAGAGLVLADNAADNLTVAANGTFDFATAVKSGAGYAVSVKTQPSVLSQTCSVAGGSGTATDANVSVTVTCVTNSYAIGGTVSGLSGSGLTLQDNGADSLSITASGTFKFAHPVPSGAAYSVSVAAQPVDPAQTCTVAGASGSVTNAAVSTVMVTCVTKSFTIGGTVTGLSGSGLSLLDNGGDAVAITTNGTFHFAHPVLSGATYSVSIMAQPGNPAQVCTVARGTGRVGNGNVTNIAVTCAAAIACGLENGTIVTHTANVTADETWAGNGTVHLIANTIEIAAPATLTIQKCAIVKLNAAVQIVVSGNPSGGVATLIAEGDDEGGFVLFKSATAGQFWGSLVGANKNSIIDLNYSVLDGGGNGGGVARNATITMNGSSTLPDAVLKVIDIQIQDMAGAGIYLSDAAFTTDSTLPTIVGSPDYAIALSAMALGSIPTYRGGDNTHDEALVVNNANIFDNLTIHKRLPIHFKTDGVRVAGLAPTFKPNITLTLDAGVVLKFEPLSSTSPPMVTFGTNGQTTDENAALIANGTATDPVIFTSGAATPAPGDWAGLWLLTSNRSRLTNVTIEYAGGDADIGPKNCGPIDTTIHQAARHTAALLVGDGTDQQYVPPAGLITNSTFQNNAGNFAIDSVWEASTFGPSLKATNTFTSPGLFCAQSKNLIPLGCTVGGIDESGCLP
jgi:hypothetical protein